MLFNDAVLIVEIIHCRMRWKDDCMKRSFRGFLGCDALLCCVATG